VTDSSIFRRLPTPTPPGPIFYKVLTTNDDSGRHGVLVPTSAYGFFPAIPGAAGGPDTNRAINIRTWWRDPDGWTPTASSYRHYAKYPERRLTSLRPDIVNVSNAIRLLIAVAMSEPNDYAVTVLTPAERDFPSVLVELGLTLDDLKIGDTVGVLGIGDLRIGGMQVPFDALRSELRRVAALGPVKSMRPGDTGIGFTLESLLDIAANARRGPDFRGIEIKASRSKQRASMRRPSHERVTMFSQIPEWGSLESRTGLLNQHGYVDGSGRFSLYTSIYSGMPNPQGWALRIAQSESRLYADRNGSPQVWWQFAALSRRLQEKHTESAFVVAHTTLLNGVEHFHFDEVTHCRDARLDNLLDLITERQAQHDFAIHRSPVTGAVRDHGFLFRVDRSQLPRLFGTVESERLT
jgi:hypothetical protein